MTNSVQHGFASSLIAASLCLLLAACSGGSGGDSDPCDVEGQNRFVHENMLEQYYWYDRLPVVLAYDKFESARQTVEFLRYEPFDRFSYVTAQAAFDNLFNNGSYIGYGFSFFIDENSRIKFRFVYNDSPAGLAGLERGDEVLQINGRDVADIVADGSLGDELGPAEIGVPLRLYLRRGNGNLQTVDLQKNTVMVNTVLHSEVINSGANKIGYLVFSSFLNTSPAELAPVFAQFKADGVNRMILDLRYNGGGNIGVSRDLASYIKSTTDADSDLYVELRYSDKLRAQDFRFYFEPEADSLNLSELVVVTTPSTCSASEQVINGLRPFLGQVTTVGSASCGKPVGQNPVNFCDSTLLAVNFAGFNAAGQGDYFTGIPADCEASDDLSFAFGDADEPMLKSARHFIDNASCLAVPRGSVPPPAPEFLQGLEAIAGAV